VLTSILVTVQQWLSRHRAGHKVKITIDGDTLELTGASTAEQAEIIEVFSRKHREA
jgi:hypothetical protein